MVNTRDRFDVCVVAAKPDELRELNKVLAHYFGKGSQFRDGLLYEPKSSREVKTIYMTTCGQQGNVYSGIVVSDVVAQFRPSLLIFAGTAGSLNPAMVRVGDVVVPRAVQSRMYERLVAEGERDFITFATSGRKLERFHDDAILIPMQRHMEVDKASLAFFGGFDIDFFNSVIRKDFEGAAIQNIPIPAPFGSQNSRPIAVIDDIEIFTCDLLINSEKYRMFINGEVHIKACAVDTESFGHLSAISTKYRSDIAPTSLIIRGISDYAGRRTEAGGKDPRWAPIANRNAGLVAAEIITQFLDLKRPIKSPKVRNGT